MQATYTTHTGHLHLPRAAGEAVPELLVLRPDLELTCAEGRRLRVRTGQWRTPNRRQGGCRWGGREVPETQVRNGPPSLLLLSYSSSSGGSGQI